MSTALGDKLSVLIPKKAGISGIKADLKGKSGNKNVDKSGDKGD